MNWRFYTIFTFLVVALVHVAFAFPPRGGSSPPASSDLLTTFASGTCTACYADTANAVGVGANTHLSSVGASGQACINVNADVYAWSSGAIDTDNEQFLIHGGGHADSCDNSVYGFKLGGTAGQGALNWSRLRGPSTSANSNCPGPDLYADGRAASAHTYDNITYIAGHGMFEFGGVPYCNGTGSAGGSSNAWLFNTINGTGTISGTVNDWEVLSSAFPCASCTTVQYGMAMYDSSANKVYFAPQNATPQFVDIYDVSANSFSQIVDNSAVGLDFHDTCDIKPGATKFYCVGNGFLYTIDVTTAAVTNLSSTVTGDKTCQDYAGPDSQAAPPFMWYPPGNSGAGEFVCFVPGSTTVYTLTISGTPNWTAISAGGGSATPPTEDNPNGSGMFGKGRWDSSHGVFVFIYSATKDVYIYKPGTM